MRADDVKPTRAEARIARIQDARLAMKDVAKSAAHQGVVARPMDQNLSKILEMKRAALRKQGTSVKRLGEEPKNDGEEVHLAAGSEERANLVEANAEKTAKQASTSAARLQTAATQLGLKKAAPSVEPPDMAI